MRCAAGCRPRWRPRRAGRPGRRAKAKLRTLSGGCSVAWASRRPSSMSRTAVARRADGRASTRAAGFTSARCSASSASGLPWSCPPTSSRTSAPPVRRSRSWTRARSSSTAQPGELTARGTEHGTGDAPLERGYTAVLAAARHDRHQRPGRTPPGGGQARRRVIGPRLGPAARLELRHNAMLWLLPVAFALFLYTATGRSWRCRRCGTARHDPADRLLFDLMVPATGAAAWMGSA